MTRNLKTYFPYAFDIFGLDFTTKNHLNDRHLEGVKERETINLLWQQLMDP